MKPADPGAFNERAKPLPARQYPVKPEDLFLPSVVEVVRHLARVAAETDYRHFVATGEILYLPPTQEREDD